MLFFYRHLNSDLQLSREDLERIGRVQESKEQQQEEESPSTTTPLDDGLLGSYAQMMDKDMSSSSDQHERRVANTPMFTNPEWKKKPGEEAKADSVAAAAKKRKTKRRRYSEGDCGERWTF